MQQRVRTFYRGETPSSARQLPFWQHFTQRVLLCRSYFTRKGRNCKSLLQKNPAQKGLEALMNFGKKVKFFIFPLVFLRNAVYTRHQEG